MAKILLKQRWRSRSGNYTGIGTYIARDYPKRERRLISVELDNISKIRLFLDNFKKE